MWRNVAVSMASFIMLNLLTVILPPIFAPVVSTAVAIFLYYQVVSSSYSRHETCALVPYIFFFIALTYTVVLVTMNILAVWGILTLPDEFMFFDGIFLQSLIIGPSAIIVLVVFSLRRKNLTLCLNCKITHGSPMSRGNLGAIFKHESSFILRNIMVMYVIIVTIVYTYYFTEFVDVNVTPRDRIIFTGVSVTAYLTNILYFGIRYYNLYLDLRERDELLSPDDISTLGTRTYLRYYVICDDSAYMAGSDADTTPLSPDEPDITDTPFVIRHNTGLISSAEINQIIETQTGVTGGELRFFYGRKIADAAGRRVIRYFYFITGKPEDYPKLATEGHWMSCDKLKAMYNDTPERLAPAFLSDISRIALIIITKKTYHSNGERRSKLTHYRPSFSFREIKDDPIDFQNDQWIRVSMFNADSSFFHIKKWWRRHFHKTYI